jgi:hypothetical protein
MSVLFRGGSLSGGAGQGDLSKELLFLAITGFDIMAAKHAQAACGFAKDHTGPFLSC